MKSSKKSALAFWSWNGEMSIDEIKAQILGFAERGFAGFFIHARAGLMIPYMGDEWFAAVKTAIGEAEKYDMTVWLYDEDGWPSGYAGGKVPSISDEYCIKTLNFSLTLPKDSGTVIASYKKTKDGYIKSKNPLDTESNLYCYYTIDKHYTDLLNPKVTQEFIKVTHEVYKSVVGEYFGKTIKGIFTDEPQLAAEYPYSSILSAEFEKDYNGNLADNLWQLYNIEGSGELNCAFRLQYRTICSKLFHKNFTAVISQWCKNNNLIMTGHFAGEDGLCTSNVNGSVMNGYRQMDLPGIDFLGRRLTSPVLLKQVAGERSIWGKPAILSETFGCSGWNTSMAQLQYIWGYQAAFGVNVPCMHLSAYTIKGIRKRDYPAFFSYQEPWWQDFGYFVEWIDNVNNFISDGEISSDVLVVSPLKTVMSLPVNGIRSRQISCAYRSLVQALLDCQVEFDVSEDNIVIENGKIQNKSFCLGQKKFKVIMIAACDLIDIKLLELLTQAKKEGVKVVFVGQYPKSIYSDNKISVMENATCFDLIMNRRDLIEKYFKAIDYDRKLKIVSSNDNSLVNGLIVSKYKTCNDIFNYVVFNTSSENYKYCLLDFGTEHSISVYDPSSNTTNALVSTNGTYEFNFKAMSITLFKSEKGLEKSFESYKEEKICPKEITRCDENVLTIDYASHSFDKVKYSEVMPLTSIQKQIYNKNESHLYIKYNFEIMEKPQKLYIAGEFGDISGVTINGNDINSASNEWWLDKCIKKVDISMYVCFGNNEVVISYKINDDKKVDITEVFETERNRFYYPTEVENIYLLGDFFVNAKGNVVNHTNYYSISDARFSISKAAPLTFGSDISKQGMYFYRGKIQAKVLIPKPSNLDKITIKAPSTAAIVTVNVNQKRVGCMLSSNYEVELTDYLTDVTNEVVITYTFSNRNALGPHHHYMGEPNFVGVNTFNGVYGFEDYIINPTAPQVTWTNNYAFVKNEISSLIIKSYRELKNANEVT